MGKQYEKDLFSLCGQARLFRTAVVTRIYEVFRGALKSAMI
jgi:hypothetical protein